MQRDLPFDEIADAVGLSTPAFAEKDYYVVQALSVVNAFDPAPFQLLFAGGTCLTKAYGVTQRMSEDIDLKIVAPTNIPLQGNPLRAALREMRGNLCQALITKGFALDPADREHVEVGNEGRFIRINLDYAPAYIGESQLRPHIQIEAELRTPKIEPIGGRVSSFAAEALGEPPEVEHIQCIALPETAAEKLVALLWRVFSREIGEGPNHVANDDRLVRHIYDLHMMAASVEIEEVIRIAREVALQDALMRKGQAPTFAKDPEGALLKAVTILTEDARYSVEYDEFAVAMIYGQKPPFQDAIATVAELAYQSWKA